jgi:hypothetical protein
VFCLCCTYITTDQRRSLWAGQDKGKWVCGRPASAPSMRTIVDLERVLRDYGEWEE